MLVEGAPGGGAPHPRLRTRGVQVKAYDYARLAVLTPVALESVKYNGNPLTLRLGRASGPCPPRPVGGSLVTLRINSTGVRSPDELQGEISRVAFGKFD